MNEQHSNTGSFQPMHPVGKRIIIAGGGTGGHIFPAIAIANALKSIAPATEILFIGAKGRMEMEKVPQAGFKIVGLDIAGYNRSSLIKNAGLPFKLMKSFFQVRSILKGFRPDAVLGVGGYSSYPVVRFAQSKRIPTFIHESNSFAGKSNILLGKKATRIFTGTDGMERFFPAARIRITGNPVRSSISQSFIAQEQGLKHFSLDHERKTLLVFGGSLGAKTINEAIDAGLDDLMNAGIQLIWQTGKPYAAQALERVKGKPFVWANEFITQMEYAYAAADLVVSRSGAMTVAELCVARKPVVFVPYPFAAEDHQTANAMKLVDNHAAVMVKDAEVRNKIVPLVTSLIRDEGKLNELKNNIAALATTDADKIIATEMLNVIQ